VNVNVESLTEQGSDERNVINIIYDYEYARSLWSALCATTPVTII